MARRHEVLKIIKSHKSKTRGDGPSYRKLLQEMEEVGIKMCLSTLRGHIRDLVDDGLLEDPRDNNGRLIIPRSVWLERNS